jgi:hypothetical protein
VKDWERIEIWAGKAFKKGNTDNRSSRGCSEGRPSLCIMQTLTLILHSARSLPRSCRLAREGRDDALEFEVPYQSELKLFHGLEPTFSRLSGTKSLARCVVLPMNCIIQDIRHGSPNILPVRRRLMADGRLDNDIMVSWYHGMRRRRCNVYAFGS